ncbi:Uma2 family endonuclease [Runella salmonicolor]|uniref:Uma2 family endonuclease n=1 Tax=Runella salmonicolor TaxID=2950278 RepID=A0ABT1FWF3_9BACT|nr:Uma2 family endonuclease [Runella salmonicolor]MCP1385093.1 Uma2 family endonuclease [Runella salmonicolor]
MVVIATKRRPKIRKIPAHLVYEELDGQALPYRGYLEVLSGKKTFEEIMGSSSLQAVLVSIINWFVNNNINRKKYLVASNESGLHVNSGSNLANDIAVFEKEKITLTDKYFDVAPKIVVEVDIKIALEGTGLTSDLEYMLNKSQKMLDFGVEKVIWITTQTKKIFVITPNAPWYLVNYDENIPLLDDCVLNLAQLLRDEEIEY